jgi:ADP-heptose:LPS heptosyltransferase
MGMHMSNYLQQPLRLLGVPASDSPPRLCLKAVDERQADQWWMEHGLGDARVLCLHPGSGSPAKNWPAQRFAEVALCAQRELGLRVVLIHGPADGVAVSDVQTYVQDLDHSVLRDLPLPLLAAILARCTAYVGNDSGVSHMAAALGVPTVAIFGPTDPEVWAPRGPSAHIVAGGASCAPCRPQEWRGCDLRECLSDVTTNAVIGELKGALALEHKAEGERPQRGEGGHAL